MSLPAAVRAIGTRIVVALVVLLCPAALAGQAGREQGEVGRTRVIVLGVEHAAQLVSEANQPGLLAAFLAMVGPDAVCVERPPEQAARGDWYEFTYEVTDIVLPWAARTRTTVCPVDWMPSLDDQMLAFGLDLDRPPEIRPLAGFQGFLTFPDSASLRADFFAADTPENGAPVRAWVTTPAPQADRDFPRRLYLYRTFLQARRIRAAARAHPGGTLVVVIGSFHKPDIEAILSGDTTLTVVQPSSLGRPSADAVGRSTTRAHRVAVLSFNLLGRQAATRVVDLPWMRRILSELDAEGPSGEGALLRVRLAQVAGTLSGKDAVARYRGLVDQIPAAATFTWTGVKDGGRLDSYFDPFGNLTVRQRARVELAAALAGVGKAAEAAGILEQLGRELGPRKARQLLAYAAAVPPGIPPSE